MSPLSITAASSFASSSLTSLATRSIETDFNNFKESFSSWDTCMSKAYCKWPVVVAIIIGSLILLSIVTSLARCLCCGLECCCGCFACLNACCPSPINRSKTTYVQAPQQQQPWPQPYMAYGGPQTATFDAPSNKTAAQRAMMVGNSDALPAMPSWQTAQSRRVEEEVHEDDAQEETALGETSPQAIPMNTVASYVSAGRQARTPAIVAPTTTEVEDEQRMPMLAPQRTQSSTQQPSLYQPQPQRTGYGGSGFDDDTSYAGTQSPVRESQGIYSTSPPRRNPSFPMRQQQTGYNGVPYTSAPQSTTPFSPYAYQPTTAPNVNPYDYRQDYEYQTHQNQAPYPLDAHTSYADSTMAPPSYHSRAPTVAPAPTPSSPTYSNTAAARFNSNPYAWGQPVSPVDGHESTSFTSWNDSRVGQVPRKPVVGSWRDV